MFLWRFPDDLFGSQTNLASLAVRATLRRSHKIPPRSPSLWCGVWTVPAVRFAETLHTVGRENARAGGQSGSLARSLRTRRRGVIEFGTFHLFHSFTSALSALLIADVSSTSIHSGKSPEVVLRQKFLWKKALKGS